MIVSVGPGGAGRAAMLLDLSRLKTGTDHVDRRYDAASLGAFDDFTVAGPVTLVADVHKDAHKARLVGRMTTTLDVPCSRCLEPYALPVDATLDLLFLPAEEPSGPGGGEDGNEIGEEDVGVTFYTGETIDLGAVLREQCFLALPMKPLCRDDCKGLCSVCGRNRNIDPCTCEAKWEDPRFAPLKKLME